MRPGEIHLYRLKQNILNSHEDLVLTLSSAELLYLQKSNIQRVLPRLQKVNKIFKEIDLANQEGKAFIYKALSPSELNAVLFFEYEVFPFKYRILYPECT